MQVQRATKTKLKPNFADFVNFLNYSMYISDLKGNRSVKTDVYYTWINNWKKSFTPKFIVSVLL